MHIPLTREEIACFLETSKEQVDELWTDGLLSRTVFDEKRPSALLSRSSVFDVIEHALWSGALEFKVSKADASMWVHYLCEMCDCEPWNKWTLTGRAVYLLEAARQDGLQTDDSFEARGIASVVIKAHAALIDMCASNDASAILFEHRRAS